MEQPGLMNLLLGPPNREEFIDTTATICADYQALVLLLMEKGIISEEEWEHTRMVSTQIIEQMVAECRRDTIRDFRKFAKDEPEFAELFDDTIDEEEESLFSNDDS